MNLTVAAGSVEYGSILCKQTGYQCIKIKPSDSWGRLFPDLEQRKKVMFANRYNGFLKQDMIIAVPDHISEKSLFDISPLPLIISSDGERVIIVNQMKMAWGAYNKYGQLMRWGPISSGTEHCAESVSGCTTPSGTYRIQHKQGKNCYSGSLPVKVDGGHGGAYMPYCMFFYKGYALHGSDNLPGYNFSHGCVRLLYEDAKWLNQIFTNLPDKDHKGTKVIVLPLNKEFVN